MVCGVLRVHPLDGGMLPASTGKTELEATLPWRAPTAAGSRDRLEIQPFATRETPSKLLYLRPGTWSFRPPSCCARIAASRGGRVLLGSEPRQACASSGRGEQPCHVPHRPRGRARTLREGSEKGCVFLVEAARQGRLRAAHVIHELVTKAGLGTHRVGARHADFAVVVRLA